MKITERLARLSAADLLAGREWLAECDWRETTAEDILDAATVSDAEVWLNVERSYDGGWAGFLADRSPGGGTVAEVHRAADAARCGQTVAGTLAQAGGAIYCGQVYIAQAYVEADKDLPEFAELLRDTWLLGNDNARDAWVSKIVRATNAHDELTRVLRRLLDCPDLNLGNLEPGSEAAIADARAVLERIGGES